MKTMSPKILAFWREIDNHVARAGTLTLRLLRHPDATPEQVGTAKDSYCRIYVEWKLARDQLREKFPDRGWKCYPWNKEAS